MNASASPPAVPRRRFPVRAAILLAWMGCMAWLVRYELAPEVFGGALRGYGALLGSDVLARDTWMIVRQDGRPVGFSHYSFELDEEAAPGERVSIRNTLHLSLRMLGQSHAVHSESLVCLDDWSRLTRFSFEVQLGDTEMRAGGGRRVSDGKFDVTLNLAGAVQRAVVDIPDDVVLHSALGESLVRRLRPGRRVVVNTLDPTTLQRTPLVLEALRDETVRVGTNDVPTTVIEARGMVGTVTSWVAADGDVVRVHTPFGWTLERCTPDEALAAGQAGTAAAPVVAPAPR